MTEQYESHEGEAAASEHHLTRLRDELAQHNLAAFFVRDTANIQWLTAFDNVFDEESAHALYVDANQAVLHTDSRYSEACKHAAQATLVRVSEERITHAAFAAKRFVEATASPSASLLGIEDGMTLAEYRQLQTAFEKAAPEQSAPEQSASERAPEAAPERVPEQLAPERTALEQLALEQPAYKQDERNRIAHQTPFAETHNVVVNLRAVKDAYELARMKHAQAITDAAFAHIIAFMRPGMTEREVQLELEDFMLRHGAAGLAFPSIVASGANGASPHAIPGASRLEAGQCVVLDFGARWAGYCSDMTRTVFLGEPDALMLQAWTVLREANETVEARLAPGVTGKEAHELAETILAQGGFEGRMGHGLGHGVGLEIHEDPVLSPRNERPLVPGNVVTVEPGIYLPGQFGMRLEDFGVITEAGFEVFTQSTHELVVI